MTVITTYPGVYIEEIHSLSLSVSMSATAVPVFAFGPDNMNFTTVVRISSWMDYTNKIIGFNRSDILDVSIRTYYENGGGYCYLVPVDQLISEVPKLIDATLLVAAGQNITSAVNNLCRVGKSLFAILDTPDSNVELNMEGEIPLPDVEEDAEKTSKNAKKIAQKTASTTNPTNTPYAAVYYPWLRAEWANVDIPPSAAMAGVYCMVDLTRGVWKAPANVTLQGGVLPKFPVTDDLQGRYTKGVDNVNMIRIFNNGGTTVWGARTREDTDSWRYISVRRLFNSAERDIKMAMKSAMYEPNSQPTWELARASISNYLYRLWRLGGLVGATAADAYFVQVGKNVTMTQDEINQGQMIVRVGMAAVRPAEFIILQFTQNVAQ